MPRFAVFTAGAVLSALTASPPAFAQGIDKPQFPSSNHSTGIRASTFCSQQPGNPYNKQTDYLGWSAWRQHGAWDSRNDCR